MKMLAAFWPRFRAYLKNLLIAIDQLLGAAILGNEPDMTISAQAWLWQIKGQRSWPRKLIDSVFWLDKNHCEESFKAEAQRKQVPPEAR